MINDWTLALSLFVHLVATVVWLGGLALLTFLVWPEARAVMGRSEGGAAVLALLDKLRGRFQIVANLSLLALLVTGLFQMGKNPNYEGLLTFDNDWSRAMLVKHIAVLGMIGVGALMQFALLPALERASLLVKKGKPAPEIDGLRARERRLTALNLGLGVVVLACTAIATAI
jgi:uncharacterized membrane protein